MEDCKIISITQKGKMHENQDNILNRKIELENGSEIYLLAVSDGMTYSGGLEKETLDKMKMQGIKSTGFGGSVSRWIIKHLSEDNIFEKKDINYVECFKKYLRELRRKFVIEFEKEFPEFLQSGATLSIALIVDDCADCFWCGDSPIYYTTESYGYNTSLVNESIIEHQYGMKDCFGCNNPFAFEYKFVPLMKGDIISVTSDGIERGEVLLNELYENYLFGDGILKKIVDEMLKNPHADDISIVAMQY